MRIYSKCTVALLAFAVSSSLALAPSAFGQDAAPPPPPPAAAPGPHRTMRSHPWQANRGHWGAERWHGHHRNRFMLARMVKSPAFRERLGITAEQAQKISDETLNFREGKIRSRANLQIRHLELRNLLTAENPDRAAIDKKLQEISAVRLSQAEASIGFYMDMRSALTPEQRQKFRQMREDSFHHRGFGHPGPNGQPNHNSSPGDNG